MALINFQDVTVDFPIYSASSRSLKTRILKIATGGQLGANEDGRVIVRALDNVSFTFRDGDRVALLGHNGAGKSTLLRVLSGVYEPSFGLALVDGAVGSLIDISLGIDMESTGRENIYVRGSLLGLSAKQISSRYREIIEFSELGSFIDLPLRTYSSGMHLRLAFAVSTIFSPEILLMDEWLSVGDEAFRQKAELRLNQIVHATKILIIATHSKDLILKTCNRAIWLEHGKVRMEGSAQSVCASYFNM